MGAGKDFAGRRFERAGARLHPPHNGGEPIDQRVGIGLEPLERAAILALHAGGEIVGRQGVEHGAGFPDPPIDGFDQRIDRAGQRVEIGPSEIAIDPRREIPVRSGGDDTLDIGLQGLALGVGLRLLAASRFGL